MKKFLTILSFLTTLSSSLVVLACKTPKDESKVKNREDDKEGLTEDNKNPNDKDKPQSDQPPAAPMIGEKEKEKKIDEFAGKIKTELEEIILKKEKDKIKNYAHNLTDKILEKTFEQKAQKRMSELDDKISSLFSKSNFDQIKAEITLLFSEIYSTTSTSSENNRKNLTELLSKVDKKDKETIWEIINVLLNDILKSEFDEEKKKIDSEVEELLKKDSFGELKEKLFNLLKQATDLEKTTLK
ncbi:hypothetical protein [Mycoplasma feriruminatoris]|uniref:hypothetical protein n=1 Tax=Mycoplasma feriruminatoris TaxID=1179777 RepID=UPI00241D60F9|nr:hypothetical protein [Mycoplasma feriruminatoris]WFQ90229.1 hypothetical protein MFERI11561_00480 [Mycoplasma feriruminatoris]